MINDIYFTRKYGLLNEKIEDGVAEFFDFQSDYGRMTHSFIKRKIPTEIDNNQYFDIISPYGYGGPIIHNTTNRDALIEEFTVEFSKYCKNGNIVSEFIRFHPLYSNQQDLEDLYDLQLIRKTVGTNLFDFEDPFQEEFSKSTRKMVRKLLRDSKISYQVNESVDQLDDFKTIYYSTMERNNASDFYYFGDEYFNELLKNFKENIITVSVFYEYKVIAMGLYFISDDNIHVHISGTLSEYIDYSPAYILKYATVEWGKENGFKLIHYGGGTSNDSNNSLFKFKKKFGQNTEFDFYIGKKIWNDEIYDKLCVATDVPVDSEFFPAYREKG